MLIHVAAAIILDKERVLIAKRAENKHLGGYWEFPGGKIEANETPEECLKREIFEELNINIQVDVFFMENEYKYSSIGILLTSYLCTFLSGEIRLVDHSEIAWVKVNDLRHFNFAPADLPIVELLVQ